MRVPTSSAALFASLASVGLPRAAVFLAERGSPLITSRARLLIAIGDAPAQPLTLGLYGEAAPASVALFEGLCAGTLASTLGNKDLTYIGSSVSRIERDKLITGGRSEPRPAPSAQPVSNCSVEVVSVPLPTAPRPTVPLLAPAQVRPRLRTLLHRGASEGRADVPAPPRPLEAAAPTSATGCSP